MLTILLIIALVAWNTFVSYWNARAIAPWWANRNRLPWMPRWLVKSAYIQSAVGFSSLLVIAGLIGTHMLWPGMPAEAVKFTTALWYTIVIVPVLGSGLVITIWSVADAWKERDFLSVASAAYNVAAMAHNTADALAHGGEALGTVMSGIGELATPSSDDTPATVAGRWGIAVGLLIVAVSLLGGMLITDRVIRANAKKERLAVA